MSKIKYSHEVPKNLLGVSRFFNDYDYALDIMFDDIEYYNFFKHSLSLGREVILDNSLYERRIKNIGFDNDNYIRYIRELNPTYYIVPDAYESGTANIELFQDFMREYNLDIVSNLKIVVVHGSSYEDYVRCYKYFDNHIKDDDIIAFSGGDEFMRNSSRDLVIKRMYIEGIINTKRKHHLLGSTRPNEIQAYNKLNFITSIDTSLPIICTYENKNILEITNKPDTIIHNIFREDIKWNLDLLYNNIHNFKIKD